MCSVTGACLRQLPQSASEPLLLQRPMRSRSAAVQQRAIAATMHGASPHLRHGAAAGDCRERLLHLAAIRQLVQLNHLAGAETNSKCSK